jgi:hypothetical protein
LDLLPHRVWNEIHHLTHIYFAGTGESGKSTIAKQMRILHTEGFTMPELISFKPVVFNNTITCMKVLVSATNRLSLPVKEENRVSFLYLLEITHIFLQ